MAREIKIEFLGDTRDLNRATTSASGDLDKFAKHAGVTAGIVGAGVSAGLSALASGARAAAGFLGDALKEAEDSQRIAKVQAQLIKSTGGAAKTSAKQLDGYAQQLSNLTGIDDEVVSA